MPPDRCAFAGDPAGVIFWLLGSTGFLDAGIATSAGGDILYTPEFYFGKSPQGRFVASTCEALACQVSRGRLLCRQRDGSRAVQFHSVVIFSKERFFGELDV
jgi:hypothetical protein